METPCGSILSVGRVCGIVGDELRGFGMELCQLKHGVNTEQVGIEGRREAIEGVCKNEESGMEVVADVRLPARGLLRKVDGERVGRGQQVGRDGDDDHSGVKGEDGRCQDV